MRACRASNKYGCWVRKDKHALAETKPLGSLNNFVLSMNDDPLLCIFQKSNMISKPGK